MTWAHRWGYMLIQYIARLSGVSLVTESAFKQGSQPLMLLVGSMGLYL